MSDTGPTRTEAICRAMLEELRRRRFIIDGNTQLTSLAVTVYLQDSAQGDMVRSVAVEEHTRRHGRR